MITIRKIIGAHEENLICDECKVKMHHNRTLMSYPPQFVYKCPKCGNELVTQCTYPQIVIEYEEEKKS